MRARKITTSATPGACTLWKTNYIDWVIDVFNLACLNKIILIALISLTSLTVALSHKNVYPTIKKRVGVPTGSTGFSRKTVSDEFSVSNLISTFGGIEPGTLRSS
jgi:hypothetical protein